MEFALIKPPSPYGDLAYDSYGGFAVGASRSECIAPSNAVMN